METQADTGGTAPTGMEKFPIPCTVTPALRCWRVTFDFAGAPYVCTVEAESEKGAYAAAIDHLVLHRVDVPEDSRMSQCIEVAA